MSAGVDYHEAKPTAKLDYLAPGFRLAVEAAIAECREKKLDAKVYETYRSNELQALYYTRGRTVIPPKKTVTNAMTNLYSWHGYGLAVDVIHATKGWDAGDAWFEQIAAIFKTHGCKWGGDWTARDLPHFQWGLCKPSPSELARELMRTRGVSAVWQAVGAVAGAPAPRVSSAPAEPAPARAATSLTENPMQTSVYKGGIGGGTISAQFKSDVANADSDLLVIQYAATGGSLPQVDQAVAAPGGAAAVQVITTKPGVLEVWVAMGTASDRGQLTVKLNGATRHDEPIPGSVRWVYSVDAA